MMLIAKGPYLIERKSDGAKEFGRLINNFRVLNNLSARQISEKVNVSVSFINGIESGSQVPTLTKAKEILNCMKEQSWINWVYDRKYDLVLKDVVNNVNVAFKFKTITRKANNQLVSFNEEIIMEEEPLKRIDIIRLECLTKASTSLTFTATTEEIIARATIFENFVTRGDNNG